MAMMKIVAPLLVDIMFCFLVTSHRHGVGPRNVANVTQVRKNFFFFFCWYGNDEDCCVITG